MVREILSLVVASGEVPLPDLLEDLGILMNNLEIGVGEQATTSVLRKGPFRSHQHNLGSGLETQVANPLTASEVKFTPAPRMARQEASLRALKTQPACLRRITIGPEMVQKGMKAEHQTIPIPPKDPSSEPTPPILRQSYHLRVV